MSARRGRIVVQALPLERERMLGELRISGTELHCVGWVEAWRGGPHGVQGLLQRTREAQWACLFLDVSA